MKYKDMPKHWLSQAVLRDNVQVKEKFSSSKVTRLLAELYGITYPASSSLSEFSCTPVIKAGVFGGGGTANQYQRIAPSKKTCGSCGQDGKCLLINPEIAEQYGLTVKIAEEKN